MVSFNLKVLAKFGLCSNCSQKLHRCSLARGRKIFATARMLAILFKCGPLLEISLILLCSYFLYINDKSVMIWLKQKGRNILTFGFSIIGKTHEAPRQLFRILRLSFIIFHRRRVSA